MYPEIQSRIFPWETSLLYGKWDMPEVVVRRMVSFSLFGEGMIHLLARDLFSLRFLLLENGVGVVIVTGEGYDICHLKTTKINLSM